jgi:hypothetical protein
MPLPRPDVEVAHMAALIALGAVILLVLADHGFRGFNIDV